MMTNINQTVWKLIAQDASINTALRRGLLNTRSLALYLIKKHHLDTSLDAVISAIRRYPVEKELSEQEDTLAGIFKNAVIFTKSSMACITLEADAIRALIASFGENGRKNFRLIRGKKYAKVIVHEGDLDGFLKQFKKTEVITTKSGLGEVRIVLPQDAENVRGILARLTSEIALHEISISELIICMPEMLVYVDQKDLLKTHHAVLSLQENR